MCGRYDKYFFRKPVHSIADDSTFYRSFKVKDLQKFSTEVGNELHAI